MKSQSIVMLSSALLLLFLFGCVFEPVNPPKDSPVIESETHVEPTSQDNQTTSQGSAVEAPVEEPAFAQNETAATPAESNETSANQTNETQKIESAQPAVKLSPREQVEMAKLVEKAVMNSQCYKLSWDGIEAHQSERPLSVAVEHTMQYREGKRFTVWIHYFLKQSRLILDRESITAPVDDLVVTCNATNFTINWERALQTNN